MTQLGNARYPYIGELVLDLNNVPDFQALVDNSGLYPTGFGTLYITDQNPSVTFSTNEPTEINELETAGNAVY
jgi:hypothetical protein